MHLMLDNLPPDATEADLRALFVELGIPAPLAITFAPGTRGRPSAALHMDLSHADMEAAVKVLDGRNWMTHTMHASHSTLFR